MSESGVTRAEGATRSSDSSEEVSLIRQSSKHLDRQDFLAHPAPPWPRLCTNSIHESEEPLMAGKLRGNSPQMGDYSVAFRARGVLTLLRQGASLSFLIYLIALVCLVSPSKLI